MSAGVFRVNAKDAVSGDGKTKFGRVTERLRINLIHALTPQAKGRVERANQTLQDRLVREMRLRAISSIEDAQTFAPAFIAMWNAKFAVPPQDELDAHRPWTGTQEALDEALARREERTLSKALTFSTSGKLWSVKTSGTSAGLRGAKVTLLHFMEGPMRVCYRDRELACAPFKSLPMIPAAEDEKTIDARIDAIVLTQPGAAPPGLHGCG